MKIFLTLNKEIYSMKMNDDNATELMHQLMVLNMKGHHNL